MCFWYDAFVHDTDKLKCCSCRRGTEQDTSGAIGLPKLPSHIHKSIGHLPSRCQGIHLRQQHPFPGSLANGLEFAHCWVIPLLTAHVLSILVGTDGCYRHPMPRIQFSWSWTWITRCFCIDCIFATHDLAPNADYHSRECEGVLCYAIEFLIGCYSFL